MERGGSSTTARQDKRLPTLYIDTPHYEMSFRCMHKICGSSLMQITYSKPTGRHRRTLNLHCSKCGIDQILYMVVEERIPYASPSKRYKPDTQTVHRNPINR
jgi:hypothetical protein